VIVDRLGLRVEQRVEQRDHPLARQTVRARGEGAQVRGPQHGADLLAGATADLARQHPLTGLGAQIGIEHIAGDRALVVHIGHDRQALRDLRQVGDLRFGESACPVGHVRDHVVVGAVRAGQRQRQIIGGALRFELVQDRKIEHRVGDVDPAPQRFAAHDHPPDGVFLGADHGRHLVRDQRLHRLAGRTPPNEGGAEILRMQGAAVHGHAQQRQPRCQHAPGELVECACPGCDAARRSDQPLGDPIETVRGRALGRRPLDDLHDRHQPWIESLRRGPGISHGPAPRERPEPDDQHSMPASPCRPPTLAPDHRF